jgi:hypothetical protein
MRHVGVRSVSLESGTTSKLEESIKYRVKKSSHHNVGIQLIGRTTG